MKKFASFAVALVGFAAGSHAQVTYPSAYPLSTGTYTFNNWPAASTAGTYPANMRFYRLGNMVESYRTDTIYQDYTDAYNITSGTRINGLGNGGLSFINTGNTAYKLGAAVLALNTTNRNTIQVTWTGKTVTPNFRTYEVRLYYRVGNTATWNAVLNSTGDTVRYVRNATAGDSAVKGPVTLPTAANNQPLVQLMWKYFQVDTNTQSGARAELGINNITVSSQGTASPVLSTGSSTVNAFYTRVGTTSAADTFSVRGTALTDTVRLGAPASFKIAAAAAGPFGDSLKFAPTAGTLAPTIVYVRFQPTAAGPAAGSVTASSANAGVVSVAVSGYGAGYTNPPAFDLNTGTYQMQRWDSASAAGTYPSNMRFHTTLRDTTGLVNTPLVNDWTCPYNLTSRSRVRGLDSLGFSFINTSSAQYDNCSSGTANLSNYLGAAVLAVRTPAVATSLTYNAGLVNQGDGATPRVYNLRLQYRGDSTSAFTDVASMEYTSAGKTAGDLQPFAMNLPTALLNQPYVQFRWLYYAVSTSGASGSRPEIRLDNVVMTTGPVGIHSVRGNGAIQVYPNPVAAGTTLHFTHPLSGKLYDVYGRAVLSVSDATELTTTSLATGVYTLVATDGGQCRVLVF